MILVSFSSAEDALSNDGNKHDTFSSQGTENLQFLDLALFIQGSAFLLSSKYFHICIMSFAHVHCTCIFYCIYFINVHKYHCICMYLVLYGVLNK